MAELIELKATDLAAMLCSRVCHDLINPIGAIGNGLEMFGDPKQGEMADAARDLIASSARNARAKLEFARLAYGASSTSGTDIDTRECERVARILFEIEKAELDWQVPLILLPKHKAKLLMNMLLIAATSVPRGGVVTAKVSGPAGQEVFEFSSHSDPQKRQKTLIPSGSEGLLSGAPAEGVDARGIQPFYTGLLARMTEMEISIGLDDDKFFLVARPKAASADPAAEVATPEPAAIDPGSEAEPFSQADEKSA